MSIWTPFKSTFGTLFNAGQQPEETSETRVPAPAESPLQASEIITVPSPPQPNEGTNLVGEPTPHLSSVSLQGAPSPELASQLYIQGLKSKTLEEKIGLFLEALRVKPDYLEVLYSLAMADSANMYAYLPKVYEIDKAHQDCCKQLAIISFRASNYSEAAQYYTDAIRYCSDAKQSAEFYYHIAFCYQQTSEGTDTARTNMHQALVKAYALAPATTIKLSLGEFSEETWCQVIEDTSGYVPQVDGALASYQAERYWRHGFMLGDCELAEKYYLRALEKDPDHVKSHYSLGCLNRSNRPSEALFHFLCIEKCHPNYEDVRGILASLVTKLVDLDKYQNKRIEALVASATKKDQEIEDLKCSLASLKADWQLSLENQKETQISHYVRINNDLISKLNKQSSTIDELKETCAQLESRCRDRAKSIGDLGHQNRSITAELQHSNQALQEALETCEFLRKEPENLKSKITVLEAKNDTITDELQRSYQRLQNSVESWNSLKKQHDDLKAKVTELEAQNGTITSELQHCNQKLQESVLTCENLKKEHEAIGSKAKELEAKNAELTQLHLEMVSFAQDREIDLDDAKRENVRLKTELARYAQQERELCAESPRMEGNGVSREDKGVCRIPGFPPENLEPQTSNGSGDSNFDLTPPPPQTPPFVPDDFHEDLSGITSSVVSHREWQPQMLDIFARKEEWISFAESHNATADSDAKPLSGSQSYTLAAIYLAAGVPIPKSVQLDTRRARGIFIGDHFSGLRDLLELGIASRPWLPDILRCCRELAASHDLDCDEVIRKVIAYTEKRPRNKGEHTASLGRSMTADTVEKDTAANPDEVYDPYDIKI